MPIRADVEEWRQRYLAAIAVQLKLVDYLAQPDATIDGARNILNTREDGE